ERGSMFDPGPCVYMEKMAGGEEIADLLDLDRPLPETLKLIAERKGGTIGDVTVVMLDRERHEDAMRDVLSAAALKSMGGQLLGRLWPRDDDERQAAIDGGYDLDRVLTADDLCSGDDRVAGHALPLGDGPPRPRPPRSDQVASDHRRRTLRLRRARRGLALLAA